GGVPRVLALLPRPAVRAGHPLPAVRRDGPAAAPPRGGALMYQVVLQDETAADEAAVSLATEDGGGREAAWGRVASDAVDLSHGVALYMEDVTVSFDGFRALNALSLTIGSDELRCVI